MHKNSYIGHVIFSLPITLVALVSAGDERKVPPRTPENRVMKLQS